MYIEDEVEKRNRWKYANQERAGELRVLQYFVRCTCARWTVGSKCKRGVPEGALDKREVEVVYKSTLQVHATMMRQQETCREKICTQAGDVARRHLQNNHVPGNEEREPIRDVTIS